MRDAGVPGRNIGARELHDLHEGHGRRLLRLREEPADRTLTVVVLRRADAGKQALAFEALGARCGMPVLTTGVRMRRTGTVMTGLTTGVGCGNRGRFVSMPGGITRVMLGQEVPSRAPDDEGTEGGQRKERDQSARQRTHDNCGVLRLKTSNRPVAVWIPFHQSLRAGSSAALDFFAIILQL